MKQDHGRHIARGSFVKRRTVREKASCDSLQYRVAQFFSLLRPLFARVEKFLEPRPSEEFTYHRHQSVGKIIDWKVWNRQLKLLKRGGHAASTGFEQFVRDGFFVRKETVERADLCAGAICDFGHRCSIEALFIDNSGGSFQDSGNPKFAIPSLGNVGASSNAR
jgi:hypothetical protein